MTVLALLVSLVLLAPQGPELVEWTDAFDGSELDAAKWKPFSMEGGASRLKIEGGQLRLRGTSGSRAGVRSEQTFVGDRWVVEATLAKVAAALPGPGQSQPPIGNAIVSILFDGSGRNRIEWILTSEGQFEAWSIVDGRGERLDDRKLGTREKNPTLGIGRRGDEFFFMLNGQVGLQKTIKIVPRDFRVMLYGFGTSQNEWDSVRVVVPK